jgi:cysteine-rich repeat protein
MARVVSNSGQLLCSGMVLDAASTPPTTATSLSGFAGGCGDGVLQSGEQCDGASDAACPGNCDDNCLCPASCGDGFVQAGEACDDGNLTAGDCCSATCQRECDDGNPCTRDSCNIVGGACTHAEAPLTSCFTAASGFQLKTGATPEKNQLKWKWRSGPAISQGSLGSPNTSTTYALCVYDTTGSASSIATQLVLPPQPAWLDRDPSGWSYTDSSAFFDGFVSVSLSTGTTGRSKAQIKAAGVNLPMPAPVSATRFFDEQPTVTVQLVNDATPLCWQSTFTTATINDGLRFKAKAP